MLWIFLALACESSKNTLDVDGDGVIGSLDCDDNNPNVSPNLPELCDGIDNNCDGAVDNSPTDGNFYYNDADGDGYGSIAFYILSCEPVENYSENSEDCDDGNPDVNPDADDVCDEIDNNCDGQVDEDGLVGFFYDMDGDGAGDPNLPVEDCEPLDNMVENSLDCDDSNAEISGLNEEVCDGIDNDCDGVIDNGVSNFYYVDSDGDGYGSDTDVIQTCDELTGYAEVGGDCDDGNSTVNPDSNEICDNIDNNCDGIVDTDAVDAVTFYADADQDGYGDDQSFTVSCEQPPDTTPISGDCNDSPDDLDNDGIPDGQLINPDMIELCDLQGIDENCNGLVDDDDLYVDPSSKGAYYIDNDGDNYGDPSTELLQCTMPVGYITTDGDCNDNDPVINPGAIETCDGIDNDCNGTIDEGFTITDYYTDADGDGYGDSQSVVAACAQPIGAVSVAGDCNDNDTAINPDATEQCDGIDNNCDSNIDEGLTFNEYYVDTDGDGFGDPSLVENACQQPPGTVPNGSDCDDTEFFVNPAMNEICDDLNVDEDCNGFADDDDPDIDSQSFLTSYVDDDGDGFGNLNGVPVLSCDPPSGYVGNNTDCDDSNIVINPDAIEVCDDFDVDENCNGQSDDDDSTLSPSQRIEWAPDLDSDGYGSDSATTIFQCEDPSTSTVYVSNTSDCDDSNSAINPDALEVCDPQNTDENCDGLADDDDPSIDISQKSVWYVDNDGDGFGNDSNALTLCDEPSGYISVGGDCDDSNINANPSMEEVCDPFDVDEDCNGLADNDDPGANPQSQTVWFQDSDEDGFGAQGFGEAFCDDPSEPGAEYLLDDSDCDDTDPDINPNGTEWYGNDSDEDCDGYDYYRDEGCVGSSVPGDYPNLQSALISLQNSSVVETICLSPGTYSGDYSVGGNIELIGTAREEVFIDGRVTLNSSVNGSETILARISVLDGVEATDNGIATERFYYLEDGSFTSTSEYYGVYLERNSGKTINLSIERSELEGHYYPQRAALAIVDDSINPNGVMRVFVSDSWLRDSAGGIYLSHFGNYYNYPQLYLEATNNSMTGNDSGIYFLTQYSALEIVMYNNLYFNMSAGWYWGNYSSIGDVFWDYSVFSSYFYLYSGSNLHDTNLLMANPALDPDFLEPIPTSASPLIGYGDSSFMSGLDYFRNPRSNYPMIGAFEVEPQ
ncbi:MAG: putative metal-binding motif-containing protein [Myxococcota bacterium]|nr:putative metal-binding motif-containing protein [Myxococcota bacterium]